MATLDSRQPNARAPSDSVIRGVCSNNGRKGYFASTGNGTFRGPLTRYQAKKLAASMRRSGVDAAAVRGVHL